jgi:hypothetical protein
LYLMLYEIAKLKEEKTDEFVIRFNQLVEEVKAFARSNDMIIETAICVNGDRPFMEILFELP